ncbi:MAG: nuclear transport factor 2 family protein [Flavobacteriaceae bacterium]
MIRKFLLILTICGILISCNYSSKEKLTNIDLIEKIRSEVSMFINDQYEFLSIGSIDIAEKNFSKDAIIIGTDEEEYLIGWEEIKYSILGQIEAIENPKFVTRNLKITIGDDGKMASYSQILDFSYRTTATEASSGVKYEINNIRNSGVIKKIDGKWKIIQLHWSHGKKGQMVKYKIAR